MSVFTCLACKVSFASNKGQKLHYKTEWHQYNLKRKVASLPSVPLESFEKLKEAKQSDLAKESDNASTDANYCSSCRKLFSSSKAFEQHCQSRRHKELKLKPINSHRIIDQVNRTLETTIAASLDQEPIVNQASPSRRNNLKERIDNDGNDGDESGSDWESIVEDDYDAQAILPNQCLFCSIESKTIEENARHMSLIHSFFVPDLEYVNDIFGLLTYLGEKVGIDHRCLW